MLSRSLVPGLAGGLDGGLVTPVLEANGTDADVLTTIGGDPITTIGGDPITVI